MYASWHSIHPATTTDAYTYDSGIFADASTGQDIQPMKYNGKELDRMHGLDTYDYGFRSFDPLLDTWNRPDPLCENYYHLSPYCYCAANPVMHIDMHGDSIAILNLSNGQHSALLIQNDKKQWEYFSHNGTKIFNSLSSSGGSSAGSSGGKGYNDYGEKKFSSPEEFLKSDYNSKGTKEQVENNSVNNYNFDELYILPTTSAQENKIKKAFIKYSRGGYNLISNQCAQVVIKSLKEGNIIVDTETKTIYMKPTPYSPIIEIKTEDKTYFPKTLFAKIQQKFKNGR